MHGPLLQSRSLKKRCVMYYCGYVGGLVKRIINNIWFLFIHYVSKKYIPSALFKNLMVEPSFKFTAMDCSFDVSITTLTPAMLARSWTDTLFARREPFWTCTARPGKCLLTLMVFASIYCWQDSHSKREFPLIRCRGWSMLYRWEFWAQNKTYRGQVSWAFYTDLGSRYPVSNRSNLWEHPKGWFVG